MLKDQTFISFIIPVYNVQDYLEACIDSIINQTDSDWEIIMINDGSTDSSGKIADELATKDERIKVLHKKNEGVSVARNMGIQHATGQYIAFVDSDDLIVSDYVESIKNVKSLSDIIFFGCQLFGDRLVEKDFIPKPINNVKALELEKSLFELKRNEDSFEYLGYTWSKVFRRELVTNNNISFIKGLKLREDEIFTLEAAKLSDSITILDKVLYQYRVTQGGLTQAKKSLFDYKEYAENLYRFSQIFNNQILKNELMEQSLIHLYMGYSSAIGQEKKTFFDRIFQNKKNSNFKYKPQSKRAKLLFGLGNFLSKRIIKNLSLIEKNKF